MRPIFRPRPVKIPTRVEAETKAEPMPTCAGTKTRAVIFQNTNPIRQVVALFSIK
jgi:hypothetical protein